MDENNNKKLWEDTNLQYIMCYLYVQESLLKTSKKNNNNRNDNEDVLRIMIYQKWIIKKNIKIIIKKHFNLNINYFINQLCDEFEYTYMQRKRKTWTMEIEKSLYESYGLESEEWRNISIKTTTTNPSATTTAAATTVDDNNCEKVSA